eukprot:CAMPEP_0172495084 /NCGR_PEP_ID=MMETSP1066-20121228/63660_1 /TAXON_ID=671091 /ORGANISM="Coscinodiscus wailesii, Strain CCMP2513" /LENGTH=434 /DNA_ID=CAMNT_0013266541 /DNA_START=301 /DNA_END=1605 /DNA_ORIENTATION=+
MTVLFISETLAFSFTSLKTSITLDDNTDPQIRINFNITLMDLHCDYISVDVLDSLGTNRQNVTKNIEKWQLDADGRRRVFGGRNREQREVRQEEHAESLEELHENGVHAPELTEENFQDFVTTNELSFINFFAPWCIWCQRLHPTWEKFAEKLEEDGVPVGVASVDCVAHAALCREKRIQAFPTLRWFRSGDAISPDYKMDRTVNALTMFTKNKLQMEEKFKDWEENKQKPHHYPEIKRNMMGMAPEHPGCQVSGHLMVNRVPGNFHIQAKSKSHNLNAAMTNLTHKINHLSFGDDKMHSSRQRTLKRVLAQVPDDHKQIAPIDESLFHTNKYHQAYHHYIKVVSTHLKVGSGSMKDVLLYQFIEQNQIVYYDVDDVPEARFSYDISPMSVVVEKESRKWYDYLTSLCAIIGGTFTTLGLIDAFFYKVFRLKKD